MDIAHQHLMVAAQGYSELGMPEEALRQLDQLPQGVRDGVLGKEMRLGVLMQAKRFKQALPLGMEICALIPDKTIGFIHTAFCLHELGKTVQALELLLKGPDSLRTEATYYYNMACYEAVLGNLDEARLHLNVSFKMDERFKEYALDDPDLAGFLPELLA